MSVSWITEDPELAHYARMSMSSTKLAAAMYMPDLFYRPFCHLHDQIFALIDDPTKQKVAIAAPRGFGKTTIDTIGFPGRHILFDLAKFIVPISCTATQAELQSENLKYELLGNDTIRGTFGEQKTDNWSKDQWITKHGCLVKPRGSNQQVRGLLHRGRRPDLIICDDLEDAESVRNPEQRQKLKEWFFADVCNSIDRGSKNWKIIFVGTVLHEDALLVNLLDDPEWASVRLSICDDELRSNYPEFMSDQDVKELYTNLKNKGQADVFAREYRNIPISKEDATFRPEYWNYLEPTVVRAERKDWDFIVLVDPAKTVKLHSADSAVVCWGVNRKDHRLYFADCVSGKFYPDEIYDAMFDMAARWKARILGIEVTSLNEFIVQPVKNEIMRRGVPIVLHELKARGHKEERVAQLVPFYRQGYIYHNPAISQKLELQLEGFPRSALWDVMDAAAYIVEALELDENYFMAPDEGEMTDNEAEYADLDAEPKLGPWRIA